MKETILLFNIPDKSVRNTLRNILTPLKCNIKYIESPHYSKTIGQLAGLYPTKNVPVIYTGSELEASMIVFSGISSHKLDIILAAFTSHNMSFPYKACVTETNASWTVPQLFEEIKKEHQSMTSAQIK